MHGRTAEINSERIGRHMWSIPSRGSTTVAVHSGSSSPKSFVKGGRKIKIGDCALFKSPHETPPFIGIIHELTSTGNDSGLKLGVSWLYRPGEVELSKGVAVRAAPNEVFYSFHRDETPAASLLHPCKVAFLPKGAELPSGVSSFVCRRIYDITNRRLWWLTDKDFLNVHQEEIDKLLQKSRLEMHTTVQQQHGTPPKPVNGATSGSPLKLSPDSMQGGSNIYSSQCKGRKRELSDQTSELMKRERRTEDTDSTLLRSNSSLKSEIARTAERGGLLNLEAVERLVQLMLIEKSQRKVDLSSRSMLAGILAATDNSDCLNQFVQSKGLPILDEWLKEVHKGKVCDLTGLKESEKSVEDFLFVLLRALDKLPMNLDALQMCNIGKSVNHLRSHKNTEIQKKSRSLVDRWKKRVEAEMSSNEPKSSGNQVVSCPSRSRYEATHGGNKDNGGPVDSVSRGSSHLTPSKSSLMKHVHGETILKSSGGQGSPSSPPASVATCYKEGQPKVSVAGSGGSEPPHTTNGEDKSSSSSQSHTNSQCSSDRGKNFVPSGKDDAGSSTARSKSIHKNSGSSKHRKSANGPQGMPLGAQKESGNTRNSLLSKVPTTEKLSSPRATGYDSHSMPMTEGNTQKIIVKIPNQGCNSPGQNTDRSVVVDPSSRNSRASSPDLSDKHVQTVHAFPKDKTTPSCSNNVDDGLPVAAPVEMHDRSGNETSSHQDVPNVAIVSSTVDTQLNKSVDSSLNALIDSCVKYSDANVSPAPVGDESGMDLLASVAAGETPMSSAASPAVSIHKVASAADNYMVDHDDTKESNGTMTIGPSSVEDDVLPQKGTSLKTNTKTEEAVEEFASSSPVRVTGKKKGETVSMGPSTLKDENHDPLSESRIISHSSMLHHDSVKIQAPVQNDKGTIPEDILTCAQPNSDVKIDNNQQGLNPNASLEKLPPVPESLESLSEKGQDGTHVKLVPDAPVEVGSENANEKESYSPAAVDENLRTKEENKTISSITIKGNTGCSEQIEICKGEVMENRGLLSPSGGSSSKINSTSEEVELPSSSKNIIAVALEGPEKDELEDLPDRASSPLVMQVLDTEKKPVFDLNEGLNMDDAKTAEPITVTAQFASSIPFASSSPSTSGPAGLHASVTVAAAAKGPFVPPDDLLKNRAELGWKGSAATSAFRPAEPRKALEVPTSTNGPSLVGCTKLDRPVFDFDLNVTDEKLLQDTGYPRSAQDTIRLPDKKSGGLELDLNQVDDSLELNHHVPSYNRNIEVPSYPIKPLPFGACHNGVVSAKRDFDLNDGPSTDEANLESSLAFNSGIRGDITPQSSFGLRINNGTNTGNLPQWYSPGTTYSAITTPLALPNSGVGPPHRMLGGPITTSSFSPELYRGPVLTSSPAMPFPTTSFHYPVFPFGTSFPLPTSSLPGSSTAHVDQSSGGRFFGPPIPTQLVGMASVSSPYFRPCVSSFPEISGNGVVESSRKWGRQGLDLNSGPGGVDVEGRDEALLMPSRQLPVVGQHTLVDDDQPRAFNLAGGGVMKRKEPEGGWDAERMRFKQPSWQ